MTSFPVANDRAGIANRARGPARSRAAGGSVTSTDRLPSHALSVLGLQQRVGNRAVNRLISGRQPPAGGQKQTALPALARAPVDYPRLPKDLTPEEAPARVIPRSAHRAHAPASACMVTGLAPGTGTNVPTSAVWVQRYVSGEHAMVGAAPGTKETMLEVNGVKMTYGEMTALGDHFKDPQQLQKAGKKELAKLRDLVRRERAYLEGKRYRGKPAKAVTEKEWDEATGGRYSELAKKNVEHYASADGGVGHRVTWRSYHAQALGLAQKGRMHQATKVNAFGDHFLTDAFAAGHFVSRIGTINTARAMMKEKGFGHVQFATRVAPIVFADADAARKLSGYEVNLRGPLPVGKWVPATPASFVILMSWIHLLDDSAFYGAFLKAVHDQLNRDIRQPGGGLWVRNAKGDEWRLPGDETLLNSGRTLAIIREAVAQSRQNLLDVRGKADLDHGVLIKKVEDFIPTVTAQGAQTVADAMRIADPRSEVAPRAYAQVIIELLDYLVEKLEKKWLIRPVPNEQPTVPSQQPRHGPPRRPSDAGPG